MNIKDIAEKSNLDFIVKKDSDIKSAYICDLLSIVLNKVKPGSIWLTVQAHKNIIAVAKMAEIPAIVICDGFAVDQDTLDAAMKEDIALLITNKNAYELSCMLHDFGIE